MVSQNYETAIDKTNAINFTSLSLKKTTYYDKVEHKIHE